MWSRGRTPLLFVLAAFVFAAPGRVGAEEEEVEAPVVRPHEPLAVAPSRPRPAANARVTLEAPRRGRPFVDGRLVRRTDAEGVARFPLLPPDLPVALLVEPPGNGLLPFEATDRRPADATIVLARAFAVAGRVVDAAGDPVPDATVFARAAAGAPPLPPEFSWTRIEGGFVLAAITGPDGRFEIRGLPHRRVELFATLVAPDGTKRRSPIAPAPAGDGPLVLRLR